MDSLAEIELVIFLTPPSHSEITTSTPVTAFPWPRSYSGTLLRSIIWLSVNTARKNIEAKTLLSLRPNPEGRGSTIDSEVSEEELSENSLLPKTKDNKSVWLARIQ